MSLLKHNKTEERRTSSAFGIHSITIKKVADVEQTRVSARKPKDTPQPNVIARIFEEMLFVRNTIAVGQTGNEKKILEPGLSGKQMILIRVRDHIEDTKSFRMPVDLAMKKLFDIYTVAQNALPGSFRFQYEGQRVLENDKPLTMGM